MPEATRQYAEREEVRERFKQEALASWAACKDSGRHLAGQEIRTWLNTWVPMTKGQRLSATTNRHRKRYGRLGALPTVLRREGPGSGQVGRSGH